MKPERIIAETFDPVAFAFPQWQRRRDDALEKARLAIKNLEAQGYVVECTDPSRCGKDDDDG